MDELKPIFEELLRQPVAFCGGFVAGLLRLDLAQDPLKSWLEQQGAKIDPPGAPPSAAGPQSISID
ncbi:MAG: hypothetical protein HC919_00260 [Oscillatoriales cyanobacterium SM2_2_1]|nr:hypothetical protein [Oscillatoriales cyanobacterium SM2_2_1]